MVYRIGIKYCGGCMPAYDRTGLVETVRARLNKKAVFVPWDDPDTHFTLVAAGCPTACADTEAFSHKPVYFLKAPANARSLINLIESEQTDELAELLSRHDHNGR